MKTASAPSVTVRGKKFRRLITADHIAEAVSRLAKNISTDFDNPLLVCVLKGGYLFTADLARAIDRPTETDFIQVSSYDGLVSTGSIKYRLGLSADIKGRDVIVVEDVLDTGNTLSHILADFKKHEPASLSIAVLLHKAEATRHPIRPQYVGFVVPNHFVLGYGLDYDEHGRNLADIYILDE
jgi:hypoxanthine phosphoribosyltransferase